MRFIDLRSDTVTQPTEKMRQMMLSAVVGDDVYGEDETVTRLEKIAALKVGKEAAIFVPSGTMGNQIAVMTHTRSGDEIIIDESYHIVQHEVGAAAVLSGIFIHNIKSEKGIMSPELVEKAIREDNIHYPDTGLICLENANSLGIVVPLENMENIYEIAKQHNIPVHLDGARVFNAAVALGVDVKKITRYCDSVMFCLSKGLCAPVGSILAGNKEFINKARKNRKLLGGGMRQAGFLAAAGIIALEEMVDRLAEDHANAQLLAENLSKLAGVNVNLDTVKLNMVFFKVENVNVDANEFIGLMHKKGIKINGPEGGIYRFVTNNDVKKEDIPIIIKSVSECLALWR